MRNFLVGMLLMLITFSSYAGVWCLSYCIPTEGKLAELLTRDVLPSPKQIAEIQSTTVGGSNYSFEELLSICKKSVKDEFGKSADGILVQFSSLTGKLIPQNTFDGCGTF